MVCVLDLARFFGRAALTRLRIAGTTGLAKGVMLTHRNIVANGETKHQLCGSPVGRRSLFLLALSP